jgi:membrane protein implicated in regulation of membrane protease activity
MENHISGRIVKVVTTVFPKKGGRISFEGTDWDAICLEGEIPAGSYARILERNNLTFTVTNVDVSEVDASDSNKSINI